MIYFALEPKADFLIHIRKLNSNSQDQEVVSHYIFKENVNLLILVFMCISLT